MFSVNSVQYKSKDIYDPFLAAVVKMSSTAPHPFRALMCFGVLFSFRIAAILVDISNPFLFQAEQFDLVLKVCLYI